MCPPTPEVEQFCRVSALSSAKTHRLHPGCSAVRRRRADKTICAVFPHSGFRMRHCARLRCSALLSGTRRNRKYWELGMGRRWSGPHVCVHVRCDLNGNEQRWSESSRRSMKTFGFKTSLNFDKQKMFIVCIQSSKSAIYRIMTENV